MSKLYAKKRTNYVTHEEISAALVRFQVAGGCIEKLPMQQVVKQMMIGEEKYNDYEPISAFISLG